MPDVTDHCSKETLCVREATCARLSRPRDKLGATTTFSNVAMIYTRHADIYSARSVYMTFAVC
jgi:hypothetical protein